MIALIVILFLAYLLGSIPSSVWVGKITKGIDIRDHGSGNAGATNTFRVLGFKSGVVVAIIDFFKGLSATIWITQLAGPLGGLPSFFDGENAILFRILAALMAVFGHLYPIFAGFKGGKGMLTAGGSLMGVEPISVSVAIAAWIATLLITRYVSVASITASIVYPLTVQYLKYFTDKIVILPFEIFSILLCFALIYKHKSNIKKLMAGTENRVNSFKPSKGRINS